MFLKHKSSKDLVEILDLDSVYNPLQSKVSGRFHAGEEMQDAEMFHKADLIFPSGESLPLCWLDPDYQKNIAKTSSKSAVAQA